MRAGRAVPFFALAVCAFIYCMASGWAAGKDAIKTGGKVGQAVPGNPVHPTAHAYKEVDAHRILADVYLPHSGTRHPAVVYIHGGGYVYGSRREIPLVLSKKLLDAGYAVVSIDYRLAPQTKLEPIWGDVRDACRWVRKKGPELFGIDPERVAVIGGSSGGAAALAAGGMLEPRLQAVISISSGGEIQIPNPSDGARASSLVQDENLPADLVESGVVSDGNSPKRLELLRFLLSRQNEISPAVILGFDPKKEPERMNRLQPINTMRGDYPPTLLVHAEQDPLAPHEGAVKVRDRLSSLGVANELVTLPGSQHSSKLITSHPEIVEKVVSFLNKHMRRTSAH